MLALLVLLTAWPCDGQVRRRVLMPLAPSGSVMTQSKLWLIADNASVLGGGGQFLDWWKSEVGIWYATNTGSYPLLTNGVAPNGHKAARYSAGTDYLRFAGLGVTNMLKSVSNMTYMAVVYNNPAVGSGNPQLSFWSIGDPANPQFARFTLQRFGGMDVRGQSLDSTSTQEADVAYFPTNKWFLLTVEVSWTNNYVKMWTNNVLAVNDTTWGVPSTITTNTASIIAGQAYGKSFAGDLAEEVYWVPALSGIDRSNAWLTFSNKYSLWP